MLVTGDLTLVAQQRLGELGRSELAALVSIKDFGRHKLWTLHEILPAKMTGAATPAPPCKSRPAQINPTPRPARPNRLTVVSLFGRQKSVGAVPGLECERAESAAHT